MTGAAPREGGERTQPMALPPWPRVAGGWPSGRAERGPYADADTVDEPDAWAAGQTGPGSAGSAPSGQAPAGAGRSGADSGQGPPGAGPGGPLLAWLWGEQGQAGEYLLASNSVTVGRDPGSDIVLIDETVSREHAKIEYVEGQWWLRPTDSAGPTWLNGEPVEPGQRLPVTDGDRLRFGFHTQFRLLVPNAR